jgi:environmental stress-induced protein Ves
MSDTMQTIVLADVPATLWRNGGGLTRLLASGRIGRPVGQPHLESFDWRISLADIAADGPFSCFPGVDRHALLLGAGAVELSGPSGGACALPLQPISFPGEAQLHAQRLPGSLQPRLLNLMVRRSVLRGELRVIERACRVDDAVAWALLPLAGRWRVRGAAEIAAGQAVCAGDASPLQAEPLEPESKAVLARIHCV